MGALAAVFSLVLLAVLQLKADASACGDSGATGLYRSDTGWTAYGSDAVAISYSTLGNDSEVVRWKADPGYAGLSVSTWYVSSRTLSGATSDVVLSGDERRFVERDPEFEVVSILVCFSSP